jgi:hypothetical protein
MWSVWIVGVSACTNQSETNAEAVAAVSSSTALALVASRGGPMASPGPVSERRYRRSQVAYTSRIAAAPTIEIVFA